MFSKNNKGVSYIELILVIAIMVLLTSFVTTSMGFVNRSNVTKGADKVKNGFAQAKSLSLAKGEKKGSITFMSKGNNVYYYFGEDSSKINRVCSSPCELSCKIKGSEKKITGNTQVRYTFDHSTAAFKKVYLSTDGGSNFSEQISDISGFTGVNEIIIKNKSGKKSTIKFNLHVGNVQINN